MYRYTVSELTAEVASIFSESFADIAVEGEISGFKAHSSGHWYFSLKDGNAVLSCAMFRGDNQKVRRPPKDGDRVLLQGALSIYPPRGTYSLIARKLEAVGSGDLLRRLEELRARLTAEGLFDPARKRPLPKYPRAIGVVTSPTGAAFQDIVRVVRGRHPGITIYLAPCKVQGDGAAAEIAAGIALLNEHGKSDVLIVGRGGGSIEDLWAFNEELVVRAVRGSRIPVVAAVGHEVDVSLTDFAADVRAATPSHAAELTTPVAAELHEQIGHHYDRLELAIKRRLRDAHQRLARIRLVHPRERIARGRLRCDELSERMQLAVERALSRRRDRLAAAARALQAMSPLAVLDRGYAIALRDGHPVLDASTLVIGDSLQVRFSTGSVDTTITRLRPPP